MYYFFIIALLFFSGYTYSGNEPDYLLKKLQNGEKIEESYEQFEIGNIYNYGRYARQNLSGFSQNHREAAKWYRKAAELGHASAQYQLGVFYHYGRGGLPKNHQEAAKWYRKAAEQGNNDAQYELGAYYQNGDGGLSQDYSKALKWYRKSKNRDAKESLEEMLNNSLILKKLDNQINSAQTQYELAEFFVDHNYSAIEAVKWYRKAAEQGHSNAQYKLGSYYHRGYSVVVKDYNEAIKWYDKAAKQGNRDAINTLAYEAKPRTSKNEKLSDWEQALAATLLLVAGKYVLDNTSSNNNDVKQVSQKDNPKYNECYSKASERIVHCQTVVDYAGCDVNGCTSEVDCGLSIFSDQSCKRVPMDGSYYCDKKDSRNFGKNKDDVIKSICLID